MNDDQTIINKRFRDLVKVYSPAEPTPNIDATVEARIASIPTPTPQIVIQETITEIEVPVEVMVVIEKLVAMEAPGGETFTDDDGNFGLKFSSHSGYENHVNYMDQNEHNYSYISDKNFVRRGSFYQ